MNDLIDTYLDDVPQRLADLQSALDAMDADGLHRASHTLKGSSSNLGLLGVMRPCTELSDRTRNGNTDGAAELVTEILAASKRAETILEGQRG